MLRSVLLARGTKTPTTQLEQFLTFVQQTCPRFPKEGTVNEHAWARAGQKTRETYTAEGRTHVPVFAFRLWTLTREALGPVKEGCRAQENSG